jgi:hypothetical protein
MANHGVETLSGLRKKITQTHELISTSYHESGHTIYGLVKGFKIDSVSVFENKKSQRIDGFTHYNGPGLSSLEDKELFSYVLNTEICLRYAGLVAEKCHFKKMSGSDKFPLFLRDGSSDDTLTAAAQINDYNLAPPGRKRYAFKQKLIKETQLVVNENWDSVTDVAHALFKKRRLTYEDLRKVLTKNAKNKKYWKSQFNNISYIYENAASLDENDLKTILLP